MGQYTYSAIRIAMKYQDFSALFLVLIYIIRPVAATLGVVTMIPRSVLAMVRRVKLGHFLLITVVPAWILVVFGFYLFYTLRSKVPEILALIDKIQGIFR